MSPTRLLLAACFSCPLLAGCLATPQAEPLVVSTSERRAQYRGELRSIAVLAAPVVGTARKDSGDQGLSALLDVAVRRELSNAGVPSLPPDATSRRFAASHLASISAPPATAGRAALQVELRDSLTRTLVWRYAGELDAASGTSQAQLAERLAGALIHRLREDGLLAR